MEMPQPTDKKDIQRLLGLVNYVAKFLPNNVSEITSPLREILKKDVIFSWESNQQKFFEQIKKLIASAQCLNLYDVKKDVVLEVDACKTGLVAVLIQDGRPVACAPRAMTSAQQNYAIIEKELHPGRGVRMRKISPIHLYGKHVPPVYSDHKPLEKYFKEIISSSSSTITKNATSLTKIYLHKVQTRYILR